MGVGDGNGVGSGVGNNVGAIVVVEVTGISSEGMTCVVFAEGDATSGG